MNVTSGNNGGIAESIVAILAFINVFIRFDVVNIILAVITILVCLWIVFIGKRNRRFAVVFMIIALLIIFMHVLSMLGIVSIEYTNSTRRRRRMRL